MSKFLLYCLLLTLALTAPVRGASEPVKLRVSLLTSKADPFIGEPMIAFKSEVERETDNGITVEIFDNNEPIPYDEFIDAVRSGRIEMAASTTRQFSKLVPAAGIMEQPFVFNFEALIQAAASPESELRRLIDDAILEKAGVRVLWWETFGLQVLYAKNRFPQYPDQIKDMKIGTLGETIAGLVRHCGGVPVELPIPKLRQALGNETLDMVMFTVGGVKSNDFWQVASSITRTNHTDIEFIVYISEKVWQSLSKEYQRIIMQAAKKVEGEARRRAVQIEAAAYDFARSKGMKIYDLSTEHVVQWRACSADVLTDYLSTGGELAQRFMKAYGKLRTQPCCSAGPSADAFKGR